MKTFLTINPEGIEESQLETYTTRIAARAIVLDNEGRMALMKVGLHNYYKLPGGGVDEGEDIETGLRREIREEVGCDIEIAGEIGKVIEYRGRFSLMQESYNFIARVVGEKGIPELTQQEREQGFEPVWVSPAEALALIQENHPDDSQYSARFMVQRDSAIVTKFLETYVA